MSVAKDPYTLNPKDALAGKKLPLHVVPMSLLVYASLGFLEGVLKYGKFNWRATEVRASVYVDALLRHVVCWSNGEECDPDTGIPHLANAVACIGILIDARIAGTLVDDRAPDAPVAELLRELALKIPSLKELFADKDPKQWTRLDPLPERPR